MIDLDAPARHGGGPGLSPDVPSREAYCPKCKTVVEFRLHKAGFNEDGTQRERWRCRPCKTLKQRRRARAAAQQAKIYRSAMERMNDV